MGLTNKDASLWPGVKSIFVEFLSSSMSQNNQHGIKSIFKYLKKKRHPSTPNASQKISRVCAQRTITHPLTSYFLITWKSDTYRKKI